MSTWVTEGIVALALAHLGDEQHVGAVAVDLEPLGRLVREHRGREGAEALPELDLHVQGVAHLRVARVGQDAAPAEGPRARTPSAPGTSRRRCPRRGASRCAATSSRSESVRYFAPAPVEVLGDLGVRELRAEVGVGPGLRPRLLVDGVVDVVGDAHRAPGVARRGLHEQVLHRGLADDPAVRHAVEGDASRHAEVREAGLLVEVARPCAARPPRRPSGRRPRCRTRARSSRSRACAAGRRRTRRRPRSSCVSP